MSRRLPNAQAREVIIKGRDVIQYLRLRKQGYKTLWCGEGLICMKQERTHNDKKEKQMPGANGVLLR